MDKLKKRGLARNIIAFPNGDATFHYRIILHVAHRDQFVNLFNPKPVENIRHEGLETHVFDAGNYFSRFEIFVCRISATFA